LFSSRIAAVPQRESASALRAAFPVIYDHLEVAVASAYQILSYPDDLELLREWTNAGLIPTSEGDAEAVVFSVGERIRREIKYQRRSEKGVQSPAETLKLGSGSCRDMATLMMDACRFLGIAARFASGYLDCPASTAGRASTHAWTEVYLPALGWRGYDPTLGDPTSLKHAPTGVSNHPRGVMPIAGKFNGSPSDYRNMQVQVATEILASN
jgi:transglutaminase-like putative cysteine protease